MFLTVAMELTMDEVTRLKWMEYSNDSQKTPPYSDLFNFLDLQARHFKSVTSEWKPQATTHRSYAATLEKCAWHVEEEETIHKERAVSSKACHESNDGTWLSMHSKLIELWPLGETQTGAAEVGMT